MCVDSIFETIEAALPRYLDFLCDICAFEAKAGDKATIDAMITHIAAFAEAEGFSYSRTAMESCGDFLSVELNPGAEKGCVFMAHTDTVHEKGLFGPDPVTRLKDRIIAPGVIDCKGGIAIAMLAMKALQQHGYKKHLRLLLTYAAAGVLAVLAVVLTFGVAAIFLVGPWYLAQAHMYRQAAGGAIPAR